MILDHHQAGLAVSADQRRRDAVSLGTQGHQVHVVVRIARRCFAHLHAGVLGQLRSIHIRHRLIADRSEESLQRAQRQNAIVVLTNLALGHDLDLLGHPTNQRREQSSKTLGERKIRAQRFVGLGGRHVHRERHEVAGQRQLHHVGDGVAGLVLSLTRARSEVRRDDHVVEREQRTVGAGLHIEHVESRTGDSTRTHRLGERGFVDDSTASNVDHAQIRLGAVQHLGADDPLGLLGLGKVHGDEVALGHQLLEAHHLDAHLTRSIRRHERVVGHQSHSECQRSLRHQLANATQADDAQRLVGQFDAFPLAALPTPGLQRRVRLRHVARRRHEQSHGVFRRRHDVALGRVHHHHTTTRRGLDIDVVETDARTTHHDQLVGGLEYISRHLRGRTDDQRMGTLQGRRQRGWRQIQLDVDGVTGRPQAIESTSGDFFGNEDACHNDPSCWSVDDLPNEWVDISFKFRPAEWSIVTP